MMRGALKYLIDKKAEERFWSKVDKNHPNAPTWNGTKCWLWTAGTDKDGYGRFRLGECLWGAHFISWFLSHKKPSVKHVLHHCDTPGCVNPKHLFQGTHQDNMLDRNYKGRTANGDRNGLRLHPEARARGDRNGTRTHPESVPRGEQHSCAKLTEMQVRCIRSIYRLQELSAKELGRKFGVGKTQILRIVNGVTWKHVVG